MGAILGLLKAVLGISAGASVVNNAAGALTRVAAVPVLTWLLAHAGEQVTFSASLGFLALLVGVGWLLLEVLRWSHPSP